MKYERLFQPGKIGSLGLKNRLLMAPMATRFARKGQVTDEMVAYYAERARGGVGAVVVEATLPRAEGYIPDRLNIGNEEYLPGLRRLARQIRESGAKAILQLNVHRGRLDDVHPLSPSEAQHPWIKGMQMKAVSLEYLKNLVLDFGEGARRTREAGFDGLMVHCAHGYLACEFLSPLVNKRTDEYGGSLENRARFGLELVRSAQDRAGADYPILVRISASERLEGGFSVEEAISVCKMLEGAGVCGIDVVSGFMDSYYWSIPCLRLPRGCNVEFAAGIKRAVKIPILVAGRIDHPDLAAKILEEGKADFLSLGRALIADPEFPNKAREGREQEIRPCIACLDCMNPVYREKIPHLNCAVNPDVGKEKGVKREPALKRKRILVIGGGPAGMEAGFKAASRGHRVTLWDQADRLGGKLNTAILPPHKEGFANLIDYFERKLKRVGVKVELARKATLPSIVSVDPEVLILATGSTHLQANIKGTNKEKVVMAEELLKDKAATGQKVIILGGGLLGCEIAEFLLDQGKKVVIVEVLNEIASDASLFLKWPLLDSLEKKGLGILVGVKDEEILDEGLALTDSEGRRRILKADKIVIAAGGRPNGHLFGAVKDKFPEVYAIGDCVKPGRIWDAIHEGAAIGLAV
jgi:2,4-dienoyl-CoA reductase-like NADH-dependent reductase (Old Yellow Enzyme family)/thioredoxin reductase